MPDPRPCQGQAGACRKPALPGLKYCRDCRDFILRRLRAAGYLPHPNDREDRPAGRPGDAREDRKSTRGTFDPT